MWQSSTDELFAIISCSAIHNDDIFETPYLADCDSKEANSFKL
jgi:hypothetical protein